LRFKILWIDADSRFKLVSKLNARRRRYSCRTGVTAYRFAGPAATWLGRPSRPEQVSTSVADQLQYRETGRIIP
jgi:hypothetical protein